MLIRELGVLAFGLLVSSAPVQHPFTAERIAQVVAGDGFSSRGSGIPVLHDMCTGYSLVTSEQAASARVYVYHNIEKGFCVTLFSPDVGVSSSLAISDPDSEPRTLFGKLRHGTYYAGRIGDENEGRRKDAASWTGRGSMPGSLRLRGDGDCVAIKAGVDRQESRFEVCLSDQLDET